MASCSLGEVLRQYDLDLSPPPPAPQSLIPPRLLILACSSSKAAGDGLSARDRYTGPLWQTLKTADPAGKACFTAALSARYGLIDAKTPIADYNQVLDAQASRAMVEGGPWRNYPDHPPLTQKTATGRSRAASARHPKISPAITIHLMARQLGRPFSDIAVCGGHLYVQPVLAWLEALATPADVAANARVTVINDQIGFMRQGLQRWLQEPAA